MNPMHRKIAVLIAGLLTAQAADAGAQTSLQIPLQFDFINPGAKSLALGGAFVALADDATATFANPAGLTQLGASEVSIELRATRVETPFLAGGRLSGTPLNLGVDTVNGPTFRDSVGSYVGPGFLAGVFVHSSRRYVVAGFRHELVRIDQSFFSQGVFQRAPDRLSDERDRPQQAVRRMAITSYGASGAFKLTRQLAVGGSLSLHTSEMDSVFTRYIPDGGFTGPANTQVEDGRATQSGSDLSLAPTVGVMIGDGRLRAGSVYRRGAALRYETVDGNIRKTPTFRVPHTFAAGASFRPQPQLTVAGEITWVGYSRIRTDFIVDQAEKTGRTDSFDISNGTEWHVGMQYALPARRGLPRLRAGLWRDPDHTVTFNPLTSGGGSADRIFDERFVAALSNGRARLHSTGGIGLTFAKRIELNLGLDMASDQVRFSTSVIVR